MKFTVMFTIHSRREEKKMSNHQPKTPPKMPPKMPMNRHGGTPVRMKGEKLDFKVISIPPFASDFTQFGLVNSDTDVSAIFRNMTYEVKFSSVRITHSDKFGINGIFLHDDISRDI
jgi:hypothetical protein